jgi:hypothetical protein
MNLADEGIEITEELAQEFVELHKSQIQEWHKLSGKSDVDFFLRVTESQVGEDNGMGELVFEIDASDSHTGNPILFEVPTPPEDLTMTKKRELNFSPVFDERYLCQQLLELAVAADDDCPMEHRSPRLKQAIQHSFDLVKTLTKEDNHD